ncbi:flagellar hook-length control protein FliK [Thalassobaculum sp.]|uniref:flagellar hook-length control protein FliK n=1 Tax=Thalassobaculum sp. TaxID=2022740 RepID=UPI0032F045C9
MTPLATAAQASERAPGVGSAQKPSDSTSTQRTSAPTATPASSSAAPAATAAAASPGAPDSRTLRGATVTVEPATVVARTQGVSSAVLVQAHLAAAGDAGAKVAVQPGQSAAATQAGTTLHVGGGQPLFVGADAGAAQSGGQGSNGAGGQSGNNSQNGGQPNGGQAQANGGFTFGTATIGQRGFGGDAARAQFQEILETRTARAPLQGPGGTGSMSAGATSTLATSSMTAGPGGPQSTLPAAMASRAEATAHGRPGALPGTAVGQVAVKLVSSAADGGGRMTVRLNPEELGKVDVKLEFGRDGMVRALISAERPETLEMLQRDSRALEKALQEAGLKTDQNSLEFDLRGGHGQPTERDEHGVASGPASSATAEQSAEADAQPDTQTGSGSVREDGSYDLVA